MGPTTSAKEFFFFFETSVGTPSAVNHRDGHSFVPIIGARRYSPGYNWSWRVAEPDGKKDRCIMHESASISGSLSIHLPANSAGGNSSTSRGEGHRVIFDIFDILPLPRRRNRGERDTKGRVKRDKLGGSRQFFSPLTRTSKETKGDPIFRRNVVDRRWKISTYEKHWEPLPRSHFKLDRKDSDFFFTRENTLSTHDFFRSTEKTMKLLI